MVDSGRFLLGIATFSLLASVSLVGIIAYGIYHSNPSRSIIRVLSSLSLAAEVFLLGMIVLPSEDVFTWDNVPIALIGAIFTGIIAAIGSIPMIQLGRNYRAQRDNPGSQK